MAGMGGKIITAIFELDGYSFQALDGGPLFTLNPSISFMLNFDPSVDPNARENLETLWTQLSEGGKVMMPLGEYPLSSLYGWLEDRFGVSWQLILTNPDGEPRPHFIPSLLFVGDVCGKAQEALTFYTEVFPDSRIGTISLWPGGMSPEVEGNVMFGEAAEAAFNDFVTGDDVVAVGNFKTRSYEHRGEHREERQFQASKLLFDTTRRRYLVERAPRTTQPALTRPSATTVEFRAPHRTPTAAVGR